MIYLSSKRASVFVVAAMVSDQHDAVGAKRSRMVCLSESQQEMRTSSSAPADTNLPARLYDCVDTVECGLETRPVAQRNIHPLYFPLPWPVTRRRAWRCFRLGSLGLQLHILVNPLNAHRLHFSGGKGAHEK